MNRVGMGLAVGAGYLLGRTKKLKLAVAVGTMVAGKKLNLTPKGIAELVSGQLQNNPQFKEIGDQLRTDLRGVGKAASGAMVERQIGALADRLHGRTAEVRDQLSGAVSKTPGVGSRDSEDSEDSEEYAEQDDERDERAERDADDEPDGRAGREPDGRRPAEKTAPAARKAAKKAPAKKAPARKTAAKSPAKKAAAKRAQPAKKATGKKTAGARSAARGAGTRQAKGGGER
ncbi:DNA primase [Streptomyces olivaceus]|uniref:DNA primase n=1 Tax=Streptomyces olivaceus TaxID=47716 RepID=UPI001CCB88DB|nr:DNA primase [Streptomyces olivaceus]MBZ6130426.1 DNA primase [Streptomyces olivaceus]